MNSEDEKPDSAPQPTAGWVFRPGDDSQPAAPQQPSAAPPADEKPQPSEGPTMSADAVTWSASEYVHHERGGSWYMGLGIGSILLAGIVYLLTKDYISTGMVIIVAIAFGVFALKRPRVLEYAVDDDGVTIGTKTYPFESFKSFAVADDESMRSIVFMPLKRFMPAISVYYAPEDEDRIVQKLADFLPMEEYQQDVVEKIMRRLRF
jgi:hypothetical protein